VKRNILTAVGKCKICTINLYEIKGKAQPQIFPCGLENCPYETKEEQSKIEIDPKKILEKL